MKRIWRFDFKVNTEKLNRAYEQITNDDKDYLATASIYGSFDIELKNKCQSFLIAAISDIEIYKEMFNKYKIKCKIADITPDCIDGKLDIEMDIIDFMGVRNDLSDYFIEQVEIIVYENLTMDRVLDKISMSGIKSLGRIERKFMDDLSHTIE
jgi:hypothetical protein